VNEMFINLSPTPIMTTFSTLGSRLTNFVGILNQGLRIAPSEAPATDYMRVVPAVQESSNSEEE
ncbi:poly (ADP-ribose) polymerase 2, partial [Trifolium medium]|nr:poly (ADP-ribose) polymerase 2 [Trifolium medium]